MPSIDYMKTLILATAYLIAGLNQSMAWAIFASQEAKDLASQRKWSDQAIGGNMVQIRNERFRPSGRVIRYYDSFLRSWVASNENVFYQFQIENKTDKKLTSIVMRIYIYEQQTDKIILQQNVQIREDIYPTAIVKNARVYVSRDFFKAMQATKWAWNSKLLYVTDTYIPEPPAKSLFGPEDALKDIRPIIEWNHYEAVNFE